MIKTAGKKTIKKKTRHTVPGVIFGILKWAVIVFYLVLLIYPMLFVLSTSFKSYSEFVHNPFAVSFAHPENYAHAWVEGKFGTYALNSVIVTALAIVGQVLFTAIGTFAIGRLRFKGSQIILFVLISTMFISGEMMTVPMFVLITKLKLRKTLWALILPSMLSPASMGIFLGSNYITKVPGEIHEAAEIDGAGIFGRFLYIDLRMMTPIIAYTVITTFMATWSDYFWPMIAIAGNKKAFTLSLGLVTFQTQDGSKFGELCAALVLLSAPILLIYARFSRYFIDSMSLGAVK